MPDARQPYVKPLIMQLHYMADQHVSLATACKTQSAVSGPSPTGCARQNPGGGLVPCVQNGS